MPASPAPVPAHIPLTADAIVIGAGLSGASCARHLAECGWQVIVLEQGSMAASGASGLPVGLIAPHTSADDTRLSHISRIGTAHTLHRASTLLRHGQDWGATGVLEHCTDGRIRLPSHWADAPDPASAPPSPTTSPAPSPTPAPAPSPTPAPASASAPVDAPATAHHPARYWSQPADAEHLARAGLPAGTAAIWHGCAAWIRPAALVAALLQHPRISLHTHTSVAQLVPAPDACPAYPSYPAGGASPSGTPMPAEQQAKVQAETAPEVPAEVPIEIPPAAPPDTPPHRPHGSAPHHNSPPPHGPHGQVPHRQHDRHTPPHSLWHVQNAQGRTIAQAPVVVLAAGFDSAALLADAALRKTATATHTAVTHTASTPSPYPADSTAHTPCRASARSASAASPTQAPAVAQNHIDTPPIQPSALTRTHISHHTPSTATPPIPTLPLNPLRGQVAWGWLDSRTPAGLPAVPVNGKGSIACHIPYTHAGRTGHIWICGSTFDRGDTRADFRPHDMPAIWHKLHVLHPSAAYALRSAFAPYTYTPYQSYPSDNAAQTSYTHPIPTPADLAPTTSPATPSPVTLTPASAPCSPPPTGQHAHHRDTGQTPDVPVPVPAAAHPAPPDLEPAQGWAGIRATLPDRLPAVGAWPGLPGIHVCCGMGARGLTLSVLAGHLLARQLCPHTQPPSPHLPDLPPHLAAMLDARRWLRKQSPPPSQPRP